MPGWAEYKEEPNQSDLYINGDRLHEIRKGFEGAGIEYETYLNIDKKDFWKNNYSGIIKWADTEQAKRDIIAEIDKGNPVITKGVESPYSLVTGYGDDFLYVIPGFADDSKKDNITGYTKSFNWKNQLECYFIVKSFNPRLINKDLLCDVIKNIIYITGLKRVDCLGDTALGISSLISLAEHLVWDEGFEALKVNEEFIGELSWQKDMPDGYYRTDGARNLRKRFWAGYCDYLCMLNGYGDVAKFLSVAAEKIPDWKDKLLKVSDYFNKACDYSGFLWNYVTPDDNGVEKFKTNDVRSIFAGHMLRAKLYIEKGLDIFDDLLNEK
jgi:hypothetical protein